MCVPEKAWAAVISGRKHAVISGIRRQFGHEMWEEKQAGCHLSASLIRDLGASMQQPHGYGEPLPQRHSSLQATTVSSTVCGALSTHMELLAMWPQPCHGEQEPPEETYRAAFLTSAIFVAQVFLRCIRERLAVTPESTSDWKPNTASQLGMLLLNLLI